LRRELAAIGVSYYYRPSAEARLHRDDAFTMEESAPALACFTAMPMSSAELLRRHNALNAIHFIVAAKAEIGRLWNQDDIIYQQLFANDLAGIRLYRLVQVYRFVDRILAATEQAERGHYNRRTFFRHARYFIMTFVGLRLQDILSGHALALSEVEKTTLSRIVNELAELIFASAEALRFGKGFLAIFRSLTDAQQLADEVLRRLASQESAP